VDGQRTIADAGIGLSAVGPTTIHVTRAEELLRGKAPSDELFDQAAAIASEDCAPIPTGAARSTTSATSPACSQSARCARDRPRDGQEA
jgi:CO/xanthine dehydrogenase FAD-binding subunit